MCSCTYRCTVVSELSVKPIWLLLSSELAGNRFSHSLWLGSRDFCVGFRVSKISLLNVFFGDGVSVRLFDTLSDIFNLSMAVILLAFIVIFLPENVGESTSDLSPTPFTMIAACDVWFDWSSANHFSTWLMVRVSFCSGVNWGFNWFNTDVFNLVVLCVDKSLVYPWICGEAVIVNSLWWRCRERDIRLLFAFLLFGVAFVVLFILLL